MECGQGAWKSTMGLQLRHTSLRKVQILTTLVAVFVFVAQPLYGFVSTHIAHAITSTNVVVSPDNLDGWTAVDDNEHGGSLNYVIGPNGAPLGSGSAQLKVTDTAQGYMVFKSTLGGTKLSDLSTLSYKTYVQSGNNLIAPTLQLNIDRDVTDADNSWQGRLVYEPYMNGSVSDGQWQTWDASAGKWWITRPASFDSQCGQGSPCTISELTALFPSIGINGGANAGIGFKAGSTWTNFIGNVDAFTINNKTYDFEPASAPNGLKFTATNLNNTAVSGCDVAINNTDVVAHWNAKGVKYNYRSWTNVAGSAYNSEASAYVSSNLGTNSQSGALNQGEGDYWFEVQAIMANDDVSFWSAPCKITYDKTKPTATLTSPTTQIFIEDTDLVIKATDNNNLSKVVANVYKDGVANVFKPTQAPAVGTSYTHTVSLAGFVDGKYSVKYNALDKAGNTSSTGVFNFTVDGTKPTASLAFPSIGPGAKSFKVKFSESVNSLEAINPANYFLENWPGASRFDSLLGHATVSYDDPTTTATVTFTDGAWYVSAEQNWGVRNVHDLAGNQITKTSDYSTPMQSPLFGEFTVHENQNVVTWDWSAAFVDPLTQNNMGVSGASGIKEYAYQLMKGPTVIVDSGKTAGTNYSSETLADGSYRFSVKAWDWAGNESGELSVLFSLDSTPPVLTMDAPTLNSDGSYTVAATTNDPSSDVRFFLDGSATPLSGVISNSDRTVWTVTTATLNAGTTHTIVAKSADTVGNAAADVARTFTIPEVVVSSLDTNIIPSLVTDTTVTNFATIFSQPLAQQALTKDDDTAVLGAETSNTPIDDVAALAATSQGWKIFGFMWYWWTLLIAALAAITWWTVAAAKRRAAQDV